LNLKKRVIPIVLLDGFSVVKTVEFDERRNLGSPVTVVRTYDTRNVDEMIVLDIDATDENRSIDHLTIADLAKDCFMPLTVGGGIRTIEDIRTALKAGADKVAINTEAIRSPELIEEAAKVFGSQCLVASVDIIASDGALRIFNKQIDSSLPVDIFSWTKELESRGAGEILINMVHLDGTLSGPDVEFAGTLSDRLDVPLLYAGGISGTEDCVHLGRTSVSAICASSIFHFTGITPLDCKQEMHKHGIPVRLT
jgi:cyclase